MSAKDMKHVYMIYINIIVIICKQALRIVIFQFIYIFMYLIIELKVVIKFVPNRWTKHVFQPDGSITRQYYELAALTELRISKLSVR